MSALSNQAVTLTVSLNPVLPGCTWGPSSWLRTPNWQTVMPSSEGAGKHPAGRQQCKNSSGASQSSDRQHSGMSASSQFRARHGRPVKSFGTGGRLLTCVFSSSFAYPDLVAVFKWSLLRIWPKFLAYYARRCRRKRRLAGRALGEYCDAKRLKGVAVIPARQHDTWAIHFAWGLLPCSHAQLIVQNRAILPTENSSTICNFPAHRLPSRWTSGDPPA